MLSPDKIRRLARREGRRPDSINPFRLVWDQPENKRGDLDRRNTWPNDDIEAQPTAQQGQEEGSRLAGLEHFITAPPETPAGGDNGHTSPAKEEERGETMEGSGNTFNTQNTFKSESSQASNMPLVHEPRGARPRKMTTPVADSHPMPEEQHDKAGEEAKAKKHTGWFNPVKPKRPFTVRNQIQRTIFNSWINILILAAPVGIAINYVPSVSGVAVFVVNFIAIIPLAAMLSFATEEIALRVGETLGGLLNATFG
jgi:Ca2+:H+ antiporter